MIIGIGFLSGCNKQSDENKLIGTWVYNNGGEKATISYTFFSDKTFILVVPYDRGEETFHGT